jgi:hypothetical protein
MLELALAGLRTPHGTGLQAALGAWGSERTALNNDDSRTPPHTAESKNKKKVARCSHARRRHH